ncbi:hypothetical protein JCM8547_001129 [Rhodosporidiobolus lusitaniae]
MPTKTQALVVKEANAPFVLTDVELEDPQPNEVLVKVVACGLCHTDILTSQAGVPTPFPCTLGHEGSGIVVSVGSAVTRVQPGDSVLMSFSSCGECPYCKEDNPAGCVDFFKQCFGRHRNHDVGCRPPVKDATTGDAIAGTFFGQSTLARHALVVETSCVKVPPETDLVTLAPLGCGLQTGAGAVLNHLRPSPSSTILVTGLGAVGFGALWAAVHLEVKTIIVVDLIPSRLELAKKHGAHVTINGRDEDVPARVKEATNGLGAHYAVECSGVLPVAETAWHSLRNFGHCVSVGVPGPTASPAFTIFDAVNHSRTWSGSAEGGSNPPEFIPFLQKLYQEGAFPVNEIAKTFPVEQWDEAVAAMKKGEVIKPIITF